MSVHIEDKRIDFEFEKRGKTPLYTINSSLRNVNRAKDFLLFFDRIADYFGYDTEITEDEFVHFLSYYQKTYNLVLVQEDKKPNKSAFTPYFKKITELRPFEMISFKRAHNSVTLKKSPFNYDHFFSGRNTQLSLEEQNSIFMLYIMKRRGTLDFMTYFIQRLNKLWAKKDGLYEGVSVHELRTVYQLMPYFYAASFNNSYDIAQFVVNARLAFKKQEKYKDYGKFLQYCVDVTVIHNPICQGVKFCTPSTAKDYIDVLCRILESSSCFTEKNKHYTINENNFDKLNFFLQHTNEQIIKQLENKVLIQNAESYINEKQTENEA